MHVLPPDRTALHLLQPPPDGWVDLATIEDLQLDIRYATPDNFTGEALPGYGAGGAWLRADAAEALAAVQADLRSIGLGLRVYDAYRPARASKAMVAWASRSGQDALLHEGRITGRSVHSSGIAVDVSLVDVHTGEPLDLGSEWDALGPEAEYRNAEWPPSYYREILREHMRTHGFRGTGQKWWHYHLQHTTLPPERDVPYSCFEQAEGEWDEPRGWHRPGWRHGARRRPESCPGY